ncbi:MAG TPA: hypothetical protein QGH10_00100 [Armatimonadota bacterium]|nr:hypothetical protein [Armatimonadota bacterium]
MSTEDQIRMLADRFVAWQSPYGRPDPETCPFVTTDSLTTCTQFHSPSFMAIGLYRAYEATGEIAYKAAADRYVTFYMAALRNPPADLDDYSLAWDNYMTAKEGASETRRKWSRHIMAWPFLYGMALAAFGEFRRHNPAEHGLDAAAAALYEWLLCWRWDEGSYFRNGYGVDALGIEDSANSDDLCHMGRGLMAYHEVTGSVAALGDAEGLAQYYLTEAEPGSYVGCWSSSLAAWVVAPTVAASFEHIEGVKSHETSWGFSSVGSIDYLTRLAVATDDDDLRNRVAEKCAASMRWHFDACQFDDGACGMTGRDDKWLGQTAGAILSYLRVRDAGMLTAADATRYRERALMARDWLLDSLTPETIDAGGYFPITGKSEPRPPENLAWMLGWVLELLPRLEQLA